MGFPICAPPVIWAFVKAGRNIYLTASQGLEVHKEACNPAAQVREQPTQAYQARPIINPNIHESQLNSKITYSAIMKFTQVLIATFAIGALAAPSADSHNDGAIKARDALAEPEESGDFEVRWSDENDIVARAKGCKKHYELVDDKCLKECRNHEIRVDGKCVKGCHKSAKLEKGKCVCAKEEHYSKKYGCEK
jgi:hypothetical protein